MLELVENIADENNPGNDGDDEDDEQQGWSWKSFLDMDFGELTGRTS